jgi:hypothetical protein
MGLAAKCRNNDFTRDSGGPTCATTRAGINTAIQCLDPEAPVTGIIGFVYEPESSLDPFFQLPLAFQPTIGSQYENPVGSGHMTAFPQTNFAEPQGAHAIQVSAGNKVFSAYSDLVKPLSGLSNMDPKAKTLNPLGMKPFGFNWAPNTPVLQGEVCTPPSPLNGNGHTYQAQNPGVTGAAAPIFTLDEDSTFIDNPGPNQIVWKEQTMVIANRLPTPSAPLISLEVAGTIAAFHGVYIVITLLNAVGETLPSPPAFVATQVAGSSVSVPIPKLTDFPGWIQNLPPAYVPTLANVYVAITFPSGSGPHASPPLSEYIQYGTSVPLGSTVNVTSDGGSGVVAVSPVVGTGTSYTVGKILAVKQGTDLSCFLTITSVSGGSPTGYSITAPGSGYFSATNVPTSGGGGVGALVNITASSATPVAPPTQNTARVTPGQLPTPTTLPNIARVPSGGTFPAGRDVYVLMTYTNALGETPAGPANLISNTTLDDAVQVTVAVPLGDNNAQLFTIESVGIYEADVPTGTQAPDSTLFALRGYFQPGDTPTIANSVSGEAPPTMNTTGPGGAIVADTATGGANGTQGYRYAAMGWINQDETFSGFSEASVVSTVIDLDGYEIGVFNILTGMPNVVGRYIAFSVADSSQAGPFNWIGLVDLQVPSQNVVYPQRTLIDQVEQSATVILDNTTTQGTFNFTDTYLIAENNVDDRLDIAIPPQGVRVDYLDTVDRIAITGVPGYASSVWISLGGDYESFYADASPVDITTNGERCFGVTDKYKGIIFVLCEESGFTLTANTGDPDSWTVVRRWGGSVSAGMGPCGFRAWDANGKFIIFAHRSGLYKYDLSDPDMMTKEVPKSWARINWAAASVISVTIDEDTHTVRIQVPTGASTIPNEEFSLSYIEGWNNSIHFSTFSGKEISMDAARRWSFNDVSAFLCARIKRTLPPNGNAYLDGPSVNSIPDSSFQVTQLLYASSGFDGTVQARTPGVFSDNGAGIDDQYETMSSGMMQAVCKPEGFNLNACGQGLLFASFIASRETVDEQGGETKLVQELEELQCEPIALTPTQLTGITRKVPPSVNEFWRIRFSNNKQPGNWKSLKALTAYVIPFTVGRDSGDR